MRAPGFALLATLSAFVAGARAEPAPPLTAEAERRLGELSRDLAAMGPPAQPSAEGRTAASVTLTTLGLTCAPGDGACVEAVDRHAAAALDRALSAADPRLADLHQELGALWYQSGARAQATRRLDRAFALRLAQLGREPKAEAVTDLSMALSSLQSMCAFTKTRGCVETELVPRLAKVEATLGATPELARVLDGLGGSALVGGDAAAAIPLLERALRLEEEDKKKQGIALWMAPPMLLSAYVAARRFADAAALLERVGENQEQHADELLTIGAEAVKVQAMGLLVGDTERALTLHLVMAPRSTELAKVALGAILRRKGRAVDALADDLAATRGHLTLDARLRLLRLRAIDAELGRTAIRRGSGGLDGARAEALAKERETLELGLGGRAPAERRAPVTLERVAEAIPAGAALIETVRFTPHTALFIDGKAVDRAPAREPGDADAPRYAAYVLRHDGSVSSVDLGPAAPIDEAVAKARAALGEPASDARAPLRELHRRTFAKLRPMLGESTELMISPDGTLGLVPVGAFLDEQGHYLVERFTITYLTSGRDLLRPSVQPTPRQAPLLVGNPAFGAQVEGSDEPSNRRSIDVRSMDLRGAAFPALPGTGTEVATIGAIVPHARVLTGKAATETAVKALRGPSVLHLATHGFYVPDARADKAPSALESPMLRAGLALAGADHGGRGGDDGILTALEASSLDLRGTRLVVLSACETALGDARDGDGVYGLRRALVIAGAETVVTSLWRVTDDTTRDLMQAYYAELRRGAGRSEAMRTVALSLLRQPALAHPYFWASFLVSGDRSPIGQVLEEPPTPPRKPLIPPPSARGCTCALTEHEASTRESATRGITTREAWIGALIALSLRFVRRARRRSAR